MFPRPTRKSLCYKHKGEIIVENKDGYLTNYFVIACLRHLIQHVFFVVVFYQSARLYNFLLVLYILLTTTQTTRCSIALLW